MPAARAKVAPPRGPPAGARRRRARGAQSCAALPVQSGTDGSSRPAPIPRGHRASPAAAPPCKDGQRGSTSPPPARAGPGRPPPRRGARGRRASPRGAARCPPAVGRGRPGWFLPPTSPKFARVSPPPSGIRLGSASSGRSGREEKGVSCRGCRRRCCRRQIGDIKELAGRRLRLHFVPALTPRREGHSGARRAAAGRGKRRRWKKAAGSAGLAVGNPNAWTILCCIMLELQFS